MKIILKEIQKWKELNKEKSFSAYDYIFHIAKENALNSDIYFAFLELFWPSFILYKGYVFLKENFSKKKVDELIKKKGKVEFWTNLFTTDSYFENDENDDERVLFLTKSLIEIWKVKLQKDFPDKKFIFECFCDKESDDCGLTFYQASV